MKTPTLFLLSFMSLSFLVIPPRKEVFTLKKFEKKLGMVTPQLYAGKYEATNLEYREFLKHIEKKGDSELLGKVKIFNENWRIDGTYNEPFVNTYHQHPSYDNYPVVNVSHAGATAFCEWLTDTYNAYPKREFKKVKFRLPTEEEWVEAARAGHEMAPFPWGGYYVMDSKGQVLANFKRLPQTIFKKFTEDGRLETIEDLSFIAKMNAPTMIAHSNSFIPNDFGLHNCSGNVAEMLAQPGRTKGGSWASYGYYIQIDAEDEFAGFTEPSPKIGFRYFMEVIEE
ncbi:MAG: SUMF1/EgtB/PvdO family nonheme iron enzyme [Bacteroidota bacterium]